MISQTIGRLKPFSHYILNNYDLKVTEVRKAVMSGSAENVYIFTGMVVINMEKLSVHLQLVFFLQFITL